MTTPAPDYSGLVAAIEPLAKATQDSRLAYMAAPDGSVAESDAFLVHEKALEALDEAAQPYEDALLILIAAIRDLEAERERLREDAETDLQFHVEALRQIKAAVEQGDNPMSLIEAAIRLASIAEVRARNKARAALSGTTTAREGDSHG